MKKLALTAILSLAALGSLPPRASAWCCKSCCSCYQMCYIQPNAFSPFCPSIRPCCSCCCTKICCPKICCPPPAPCCPTCPPPCASCADGSCGGGPALAPAPPSAAPPSAPATMPPASNGNSNYTAPMPLPNAQAYPAYPPMTGYPMVQPAGYPPSYAPTMMGAPYGAGYGGTTYGPAPAYWNPNYRGY